MALNIRQQNYLDKVTLVCQLAVYIAKEAPELLEQWEEEFKSGQDNDLSTEDAYLATIGIDAADVGAAVNQFVNNGFLNMWTNEDVVTREYGKDARRVAASALTKKLEFSL